MANGPFKDLTIASKQIDEVEDFLCNAYAPVSVTPLGKHETFGINGHIAVLDDIFFEWSTSIGSYLVTPVSLFDAVLFNFVNTVGANYLFNKSTLEVSPGEVIGYRQADHVQVLDRSEHVTVVISDSVLNRRMSALLDGPVTHPIEFQKDAVKQSSLPGLSSFIKSLNEHSFKELVSCVNNRSNAVGNLVVDSFLLGYSNNYTLKLQSPVQLVAPKHVRRAIEYIHANSGVRHSSDMLASLSSVSVRSLQYSFLSFTGKTISEYQLDQRLKLARSDVQRRPDLSFREISDRCGYASQSAFTQSFKKAYGLTPSMLRKDQT